MSIPIAYKVLITASLGLNIVLTNRREDTHFRSYSHFVTPEDAEKFAEVLTHALDNGTYTELDRCPVCGKVFTRQNIIALLRDDRAAHAKCFRKAIMRGELTNADCKVRRYPFFPESTPLFDYSNIAYEGTSRSFQYAIQIVSMSAIHLYLIDPYSINIKHHFCLSYDECQGLISEIQDKLEQLRKYLDSAVGKCALCGKPIYEDISRYEFASGEMLREMCMGLFIQSPVSANAKLPVTRVYRQKTFAHTQILNESVYAYPFPCID